MLNNIKIEEIQGLIRIATEATQQLQDPYRTKAFEVLLEFLLEQQKHKIINNISKKDFPERDTNTPKKFHGLAGGIEYLIQEGFFDNPKALKEIYEELTRNGYHYAKTSLPSTLLPLIRKKQLTRVSKENGLYFYVIKK